MIETKHYPAGEVMKRLWLTWCLPYWRLLIVNFVLILGFAAVNGLYGPLVKEIVDAVTEGESDLTWLLIAAVVVTVGKAVTLLGHKMLNSRIYTRVSTDLKIAALSKVVNADMAWHGQEPAAMRAQRVTADAGSVQTMLDRLTNNLLRDVFTLLAIVASLFYLDWRLTLIALVIFPIAIWPIHKITRTLRKLAHQTQRRSLEMTSQMFEGISGIRTVKSYELERPLIASLSQRMETLRAIEVRGADHSAAIDPLLEILGGAAVIGVIIVVTSRITGGDNSVGDFAGFLTALLIAARPMRAIGNLAAAVQAGIAGGQRLFTVLDEPPTIVDVPGAPALVVRDPVRGARIDFDAVDFAYDPDEPVLKGVNFAVEPGEQCALVGPSGAGKSTIFNLVTRLYDPSAGRVAIDDQDLRAVTRSSLLGSIALVAQEPFLFNDSIGANIALGRQDEPVSEERVVAAAKAAAAHDFILEQPGGYGAPVGDRGEKLSGGQRQRLAIARAFYRDAPILLLDEPTSALDAEAERVIQEALARLIEGRTTMIIAHRFATIRNADRIVVMSHGSVVEQGDHASLLADSGLYARLRAAQAAE